MRFLTWPVLAASALVGAVVLAVVNPTAQQSKYKYGFDHVFIVLLENVEYGQALAQPDLSAFASSGALLTNYFAISHPSEPNYLALTSGSTWDIWDDDQHTVKQKNIADLIEAKGLTWKAYAEGFPGNCQRQDAGAYAEKHVPMMTYQDINSDLTRCNQHVVDASQLQIDIRNGQLPNYAFYTPDLNNDGHDTGVAYAGQWFAKTIKPLLQDPKFMQNTLVIVTFDEDDLFANNQVYAALFGNMVNHGVQSNNKYDHYSLLKTIEDNFGLGNLGQNDATASPISGVWTTGF